MGHDPDRTRSERLLKISNGWRAKRVAPDKASAPAGIETNEAFAVPTATIVRI